MKFRIWLQQIWLEHVEEMWQWNKSMPPYSSTEYFNKYKWWLKREYTHRKANNTLNDF